ncbi:hypothetical protein D1007_51063 [Hordeum vulgare]|nr:hypothetical protein D1007_51063 [Hordeum vulgare]
MPRAGQWREIDSLHVVVGGDDGFYAYGEGQHRGSSSSGGSRGYAWQSDAGNNGGFAGPHGNFAPGVAGPRHKRGGFHQGWGGRGGGRKPRPPLPPAVPVVAAADAPVPPVDGQAGDRVGPGLCIRVGTYGAAQV